MNHFLRPMARRILILGLGHIGHLPRLKSAVLRFLAGRPSLESHLLSFCESHHLSLFEEPVTPATAANVEWANYDPAVRRMYARLMHVHLALSPLSPAPLSHLKPPGSVGRHEARH